MYYYTVPPSRRYLAAICKLCSFAIGFYVWQVFMKTGMDIIHMQPDQSSVALDVLSRILIWGSPLCAFGVCAVFMAFVWIISTVMDFSVHRRIKEMRLCAIWFIVGLVVSFAGIVLNVADIAPLDLVYGPILAALEY